MTKSLAILFGIVAAALLVTGYTWRGRFDEALTFKRAARLDWKKNIAGMSAEHPASHEPHMSNEQLAPFEDLDDSNDRRNAHLIGVVESCAGWLALGLAGVLWCLPAPKK